LDRVAQFKDDMHADGNVLFSKYCQHAVEHAGVHCKYNSD